jgi:hypothetical protein
VEKTIGDKEMKHQFDTSDYIIDESGDGARYSLERIEAFKQIEEVLK